MTEEQSLTFRLWAKWNSKRDYLYRKYAAYKHMCLFDHLSLKEKLKHGRLAIGELAYRDFEILLPQ